MTERQFIKLVKEYRRLQHDYKLTGNMRLYSQITQIQQRIDAALIQFELQWEKEQPTQMELPNLFNVEPPKND